MVSAIPNFLIVNILAFVVFNDHLMTVLLVAYFFGRDIIPLKRALWTKNEEVVNGFIVICFNFAYYKMNLQGSEKFVGGVQ